MASLEYDRLPLLDVTGFDKHVATLTPSQKAFVALLNDWCATGRKQFLFALVTGGPGCGKTHAVVETLKYLDFRVVKMSYTARLADKIKGRTVHRTMFSEVRGAYDILAEVWDRLEHATDVEESLKVSRRLLRCMSCGGGGGGDQSTVDVVVVDEIGMLPFWLTYQICEYFKKSKRRVAMICMGDKRQLRPFKSEHSLFHVDLKRYFPSAKLLEMTESMRFTPAYEKIIDRLRELMTVDGGEEEEHPLFRYVGETFPVVECITQEILSNARFVLAFKNETVNRCNDFYLDWIMGHETEYVFPVLDKKGERVVTAQETRLRKNCLAMVTQNNCGDGVCNGTSVIFLDYDQWNDVAVCQKVATGEKVMVRRSTYNGKIPLIPGFSITIHKFQGETIDDDNIVMCFDKSIDLNLIYTALSRVRDMSQIMAVIL